MKPKRTSKPTVFLSHSSRNRAELLALKSFLDVRASGMIEFFLSSDDESITPGTIWPEEVRNALDRMKLMLIFASPDALKSQWTYFEAGYGLKTLGSATIYCLPGTSKASLPPPFDILQNRNLHSSKEASVLIRHINEILGAKLHEIVTKAEFDRIFRKRGVIDISNSPKLDELITAVVATIKGPYDSSDIFTSVCKQLGHPASVASDSYYSQSDLCSTGVKISVDHSEFLELEPQLEIDDKMRGDGFAKIMEYPDGWRKANYADFTYKTRTIDEVEKYNASIQKKNEDIKIKNEELKKQPRRCAFRLLPIDFSTSVSIVDKWSESADVKDSFAATVELLPGATVEMRGEALGAKIHTSSIEMLHDGKLLWLGKITVKLEPARYDGHSKLELRSHDQGITKLGDFKCDELVSLLHALNIIIIIPKNNLRKRY